MWKSLILPLGAAPWLAAPMINVSKADPRPGLAPWLRRRGLFTEKPVFGDVRVPWWRHLPLRSRQSRCVQGRPRQIRAYGGYCAYGTRSARSSTGTRVLEDRRRQAVSNSTATSRPNGPRTSRQLARPTPIGAHPRSRGEPHVAAATPARTDPPGPASHQDQKSWHRPRTSHSHLPSNPCRNGAARARPMPAWSRRAASPPPSSRASPPSSRKRGRSIWQPPARTASPISSIAAARPASCACSTRRRSPSPISPATGNTSPPAISRRTRAP